MKTRNSVLFLLMIIILVLSGCSLFFRGDVRLMPLFRKSRGTQYVFQKGKLKLLHVNVERDPFPISCLYTGDVTGDSEEELIAVSKDTIAIYTLSGNLVRKKTFEGMNFGNGIVEDINGDGKKDIILGYAKGKGIQIIAYSGVLTELLNFLDYKIYNAETKIHFLHDGKIYFSSVSSIAIPPKVIGAYDVASNSLAWKYFTGPVPIDMAADKDFSMLTISNEPKSRNGLVLDNRKVSDHSRFRCSFYVLGKDGNKKTQISFGPEYRVGEFQNKGVSSVCERFFDTDGDGISELVVGINRVSDFYGGKATLEIRTLDGRLKAREEFEPDTDMDFSFYKNMKKAEIAVLLKQKGKFYLLDNTLSRIREKDFSGTMGEGTLQESGDFNGDGKVEHLITIGNMLYILDSNLNTIFSTAENTTIRKALFVPDKDGNTVLVLLTDVLKLYGIGEAETGTVSVHTNPPGVSLYMNDKLISHPRESGIFKNVPAGVITLQARMNEYSSMLKKIKVKTGQHYVVDLKLEGYKENTSTHDNYFVQKKVIKVFSDPSVPVKSWDKLHLVKKMKKSKDERFYGFKDLAGDSSKDFLFYDTKKHTFKTYNSSLKLLCKFPLPGQYSYISVEGAVLDINTDGKDDLLLYNRNKEEFSIYSADGKILGFKRLGSFPDTTMRNALLTRKGLLFIAFGTGYVEQPRGIMGIDMNNGGLIHSFYPIAANPVKMLLTDNGVIFSDIHTPSNGCEITYSNGNTAKDSEYYIYMMNENGEPLTESFNPDFRDNSGLLSFYAVDLDNDGKMEVYMITNRTNYYTGDTQIVRVDAKQREISKSLFSLGKNKQIFFLSKVMGGNRSLLALYQSKPRELFLLNKDFKVEKRYNMDEKGFPFPGRWLFPDLDGDGVSEMFLWNDNGFYVYSLDFDRILSITEDFKKNPLRNVLVDDINNNGKDEITLFADNSVSVYSY